MAEERKGGDWTPTSDSASEARRSWRDVGDGAEERKGVSRDGPHGATDRSTSTTLTPGDAVAAYHADRGCWMEGVVACVDDETGEVDVITHEGDELGNLHPRLLLSARVLAAGRPQELLTAALEIKDYGATLYRAKDWIPALRAYEATTRLVEDQLGMLARASDERQDGARVQIADLAVGQAVLILPPGFDDSGGSGGSGGAYKAPAAAAESAALRSARLASVAFVDEDEGTVDVIYTPAGDADAEEGGAVDEDADGEEEDGVPIARVRRVDAEGLGDRSRRGEAAGSSDAATESVGALASDLLVACQLNQVRCLLRAAELVPMVAARESGGDGGAVAEVTAALAAAAARGGNEAVAELVAEESKGERWQSALGAGAGAGAAVSPGPDSSTPTPVAAVPAGSGSSLSDGTSMLSRCDAVCAAVLAARPHSVPCLYLRAKARMALGWLAQARADLALAARLEPGNAQVRAMLVEVKRRREASRKTGRRLIKSVLRHIGEVSDAVFGPAEGAEKGRARRGGDGKGKDEDDGEERDERKTHK
mmetsp:Transcript_7351/g.23164  ORF Transcript_7351/g.23164 Transcript_7351/m.23164 type:complete len:539 (-) Transcript_7351:102-1718(-)